MSGPKRYWTPEEDAVLRERLGRETAASIAARLGRKARSVHNRTRQLGLAAPAPRLSAADRAEVRRLHALGWCDTEIGAALGHERHSIGRARARMGLAANAASDHRRRQVAARTRRQLDDLGVRSLGELRSVAFRAYALEHGWPAGLRPRAVQILELLHRDGPKTRRQIAEALGMPWKGSRKSLVSNDPEGSYLAHLMARGLVVSLGRVVRGRGKGRSCHLYSLALDATRRSTDAG